MTIEEKNRRLAKLLNKSETDYDKILRSFEKQLQGNYKRAVADIKSRIADMFERYGDSVDYAEMQRFKRYNNLISSIESIVNDLKGDTEKEIRKGLKSFYSENYYLTGYSVEVAGGINLSFGKLNPDTISAGILNNFEYVKWENSLSSHVNWYKNILESEIRQGLIKGDGYSKIARAVTDRTFKKVGIATKENLFDKTIRIVRTEGHRIQSASRQLAFDKIQSIGARVGMELSKVWLSTKDSRTRDTHRQMDGKSPGENGEYILPSGAPAVGPGLSGIAGEDINCRCTEKMEFKEFPTDFDKKYETKGYRSFEEWKNDLK